jgi:hypothetical protein
MRFTLLILVLVGLGAAQQIYLNNVAIVFGLLETTNYVPNTGGVAIPGYSFNLGFDKYSWIGNWCII